VNEIITAYLYGLYTLRGGRLSAADAMNHVLDLLSGAMRAKTGFDKLLELAAWRSQGHGTVAVQQAAKETPHA
jgi:hypothetical protein